MFGVADIRNCFLRGVDKGAPSGEGGGEDRIEGWGEHGLLSIECYWSDRGANEVGYQDRVCIGLGCAGELCSVG